MAWKMAGLSARGQWPGNACASLHSRLVPSTLSALTVREEDLVACSVLGQLVWLAAILEKEKPAAGCTFATQAATPGSEGGEDFCLPPCRVAT
jgi:hypothetical protein